MIKRYSPIVLDYALASMEEESKGDYVEYIDFQTLVQLMKEYIVCNECALYDSAADAKEDAAILNKIEQFLGKGWDK